jgi:uncharacterized damage-inducible protein DinB
MIRQAIIREIEHEGHQTKKILERVPFDKFEWKPHEKSREIGKLAIHVAEIPKWASRAVTTSEFDVINLKPAEVHSTEELIKLSEANIQKAIEDLQNTNDEDMMAMWSFKRNGQTVFALPRAAIVRAMAMNHLIHHRGQLTVYLRLLNIPVPGMYGPSADEM